MTARYDQCDATCTTDCGHCKGEGPPDLMARLRESVARVVTAPSSRTGATDREVLVRAAARFQLDPEGMSAEVSSSDVSVAGQLAMWVRARDKKGCNKQETAYGLAYLLAARAALLAEQPGGGR